MAEKTPKTSAIGRQGRVQLAGEIIDRIDIARAVAEPVNGRLA